MFFNKDIFKVTLSNIVKGLWSFICGFILADFSSKLIDAAVNKNTSLVISIALKFLIFLLVMKSIDLYLGILCSKLETFYKANYKMKAYTLLYQQKVSSIEKLPLGNLKERLTDDVSNTFDFFTKVLSYIIVGLFIAIGYLWFMYNTNPSLAITMLLISFVQLIPPYVVKHWLEKNYINTRNIEGELTEHLICGYNGLSTIKSFNGEKWYMSNLEKIHERYYAIGKKSEITAQVEDALNKTVVTILTYITYGIIGLFVLSNSISLEESVALAVLSKKFYDGANMIFSAIPKYFIFKKAKDRLRILTCNCSYSPKEGPSKDDLLFQLNNLNYGFESNLLFKDFNLDLEKGLKYAIVGSNGSGKSTLLKLLLKMKDDYDGDIYYKGSSLRHTAEKDFYRDIAYVPQKDMLLSLTPKTLFLSLEDAVNFSYNKAIAMAQSLKLSMDTIENHPIDTLSGGERKKVFIIAALCRESEVVILDEPTNSLDSVSRNVLMSIIKNLDKSVLIISHNKKFIQCCDATINICKGGAITWNH